MREGKNKCNSRKSSRKINVEHFKDFFEKLTRLGNKLLFVNYKAVFYSVTNKPPIQFVNSSMDLIALGLNWVCMCCQVDLFTQPDLSLTFQYSPIYSNSNKISQIGQDVNPRPFKLFVYIGFILLILLKCFSQSHHLSKTMFSFFVVKRMR